MMILLTPTLPGYPMRTPLTPATAAPRTPSCLTTRCSASSATTSTVAKALLLALLVGCTDKGGADKIEGLVGILITPDPVVVPVGGEAQLTATGLLDSRDSMDLTALVNWQAESDSTIKVRGSLDREGELEGLEAGKSTVVARYNGIVSPPATVTVTRTARVPVTR